MIPFPKKPDRTNTQNKMTSNHVYFSSKEGLPPAKLVHRVHEFTEALPAPRYELGRSAPGTDRATGEGR
jgi:hypothetical protein